MICFALVVLSITFESNISVLYAQCEHCACAAVE
jgi:hypothetical protein